MRGEPQVAQRGAAIEDDNDGCETTLMWWAIDHRRGPWCRASYGSLVL